jgi:hypothetical protein
MASLWNRSVSVIARREKEPEGARQSPSHDFDPHDPTAVSNPRGISFSPHFADLEETSPAFFGSRPWVKRAFNTNSMDLWVPYRLRKLTHSRQEKRTHHNVTELVRHVR